jgi:hypothetical protein
MQLWVTNRKKSVQLRLKLKNAANFVFHATRDLQLFFFACNSMPATVFTYNFQVLQVFCIQLCHTGPNFGMFASSNPGCHGRADGVDPNIDALDCRTLVDDTAVLRGNKLLKSFVRFFALNTVKFA